MGFSLNKEKLENNPKYRILTQWLNKHQGISDLQKQSALTEMRAKADAFSSRLDEYKRAEAVFSGQDEAAKAQKMQFLEAHLIDQEIMDDARKEAAAAGEKDPYKTTLLAFESAIKKAEFNDLAKLKDELVGEGIGVQAAELIRRRLATTFKKMWNEAIPGSRERE